MIIKILDNFINQKDCEYVTKNFFNYKDRINKFKNIYTLQVDDFGVLSKRLNEQAKIINNSTLDWIQIVRWPKGSYMNLHYDNAKKNTSLACIIYLNENYKGGQTYFKDGTIIASKIGRLLFFDGQYYKHGVSKVKKFDRFTIAAWFKPIK